MLADVALNRLCSDIRKRNPLSEKDKRNLLNMESSHSVYVHVSVTRCVLQCGGAAIPNQNFGAPPPPDFLHEATYACLFGVFGGDLVWLQMKLVKSLLGQCQFLYEQ